MISEKKLSRIFNIYYIIGIYMYVNGCMYALYKIIYIKKKHSSRKINYMKD